MLYPLSYGGLARGRARYRRRRGYRGPPGTPAATRSGTDRSETNQFPGVTVRGTRRAPATAPEQDGGRMRWRRAVVDVPERGRFEIRLDEPVVGLASYHVDGGP